jgi:hypothetical protein
VLAHEPLDLVLGHSIAFVVMQQRSHDSIAPFNSNPERPLRKQTAVERVALFRRLRVHLARAVVYGRDLDHQPRHASDTTLVCPQEPCVLR